MSWRVKWGRKKKMLLPEIHNLCNRHKNSLCSVGEFRVQQTPAAPAQPDQSPSGTSGADVHLQQGAHLCCGACVHGGTSLPPAALGLLHQSAWFTVLELTCEQLFFQSIMSTVEALCVAKKRLTCQNCDAKVSCSVSQQVWVFLAQLTVMCECCHVRHCKWLIVTLCQTGIQSGSFYLDPSHACSLTAACQKKWKHWGVICKIVTFYQGNCTLVHCLVVSLTFQQPKVKATIWPQLCMKYWPCVIYLELVLQWKFSAFCSWVLARNFTLLIRTKPFFNKNISCLFYHRNSIGCMHWHGLQGHLHLALDHWGAVGYCLTHDGASDPQ